MKTIDISLIRVLQFVVLTFFTFAVVLWYSCAVLIPLILWMNLSDLLSTQTNSVIASMMSAAITAIVMLYLTKIPKLPATFLAAGFDLINLGLGSIHRLGNVAHAIRHETELRKIGITLRH